MNSPRLLPFVVAIASLADLPHAVADVKLPALFSDHAILQRGQPVPVWGMADAGEEVTVEFAGQKQTAKAGADGKWKVALKPLKEAENQTLTVKGKNSLTVKDVAVGEVWLASGQSNMAYRLSGDANSAAAIAAAADPQLRFFTVGGNTSDTPLSDVASKWIAADAQSAGGFSAVAYYFARDLRKALKVPVGILHSSVGGTPAEAWTSRGVLEAMPDFKQAFAAQEAAVKAYPAALERFKNEEPTLMEKWKADAEKAKAEGKPEPRKPTPPADPSKGTGRPSCLYNAMIAPLEPYAIRGAIWYQGESNSGRAKQYRTLFPAMIADWRQAWGQGEFPFFFVQIAPHQGMLPEIREAQLLTAQTVPHTAMAVITDFGDAKDIHPKQKEPVGTRLALVARAQVYGEKIEYSGPEFDSLKIDGSKAIVKFKHAAGLVAKDGEVKGFTIAGEDKNFVPAKAEIKGETVILSADGVAKPVAVRYGWANVPDVNLYNKDGLPASPFRTDVEK
jgi:sialate O-acetylesterase